MIIAYFAIYLLIFGSNFIKLSQCPDTGKESSDIVSRKGSGFKNGILSSSSSSRRATSGSVRSSSSQPQDVPTRSSSSPGSVSSGSKTSGGDSSSSNSIVLDFTASAISSQIEVSTSIPGILKYYLKQGETGNFNKIRGNGKEKSFSKKIDHVLCNSPFDNNVTVVFEDDSTEQYVLTDEGFKNPDEETETTEEQPKPQVSVKGLEIHLDNPSDDFKVEEVKGIKCYMAKKEDEFILKIFVDSFFRILEKDVKENFVCVIRDQDDYKIMVAYKNQEDHWHKYTVRKQPSSAILMDVTLMRSFDAIEVQTLFADKSTPDDNTEFIYSNLIVNEKSRGVMKSKQLGNKVFILKITDSQNNEREIELEFSKNFVIQEGFNLHSIKTNEEENEFMFTFCKDNVLMNEKYVKKEGKYQKDQNAIYKHDLERTKGCFDLKNVEEQNLLFMRTLVPDSVSQGLRLSHFGKFKIINFEKSDKPSFLVFPNLEFYLAKEIEHKLVICENGRNISMVMNTESNSQRMNYIISTDAQNGNPFAIQAQLGERN